ncbi:unnamed protein product [Mytilus edulis]|uniref:MAM domain-containing protein n=1 Tax=Mytilus edulis TaxID=6550 RepID=A0A8S3T1J8_MYTED|nr:unnamed protein product [Mytilus edulis]
MQVVEKGTRVSTFESDLGDWMNVSSIGSSWHRSNQLDDHTMIATHGINGYSMIALSIYGTAGTALVYTNNSFMEPICLSLWYQFYHNAYDCSFSIYKITDGNQTLLFTVDGNFTFYDKWINISVDVYGQDPFKMALEADFKQRDSTDVRWIIIDDTSIAYRPCQEKGTRVSTFESDLGDWMNVSSVGSSWHRSNQFDDHPMIATHGTKGYSMAALSIYGTAGTALVYTNISFMEPICLSLWYQFYQNAYDCSISIYKITDGNQTLLFTVDGNFTFYNKWINISVDVYGQDPFKMALEADFKQRDSTDARWIIIDDTSMAL